MALTLFSLRGHVSDSYFLYNSYAMIMFRMDIRGYVFFHDGGFPKGGRGEEGEERIEVVLVFTYTDSYICIRLF